MSKGIHFDKYDDIPVSVEDGTSKEPPAAMETFTEEALGSRLYKNIKLCGYTTPTPVQKHAMGISAEGRDIMACAQTGSGKTAAFLIPMIASMLSTGNKPRPNRTRFGTKFPMAVVLAPVRELAQQIHGEALKFTYATGIRPVAVYGGVKPITQLRDVERGCDLIIATPGRLIDFIERGKISLANVQFLVLDEADRMLDMGFEPDIRKIVEGKDMSVERTTFLFSATLPDDIQRLAADFLRDYVFLAVGTVGEFASNVTQEIVYVKGPDKMMMLMERLNEVKEGLILVFVETKRSCDALEYELLNNGYPVTCIHGDRSQEERTEAINSFKNQSTPILVATDIAARGLDISSITYVFNYDMPNTIDDYVHRVGRTGRAGNAGRAVSFMNERNRGIAKALVSKLDEGDQEVPTWLRTLASGFGGGGGGRRGGKGGTSYGGRDFRRSGGGGGKGGGGGGRGGPPKGGGGSGGAKGGAKGAASKGAGGSKKTFGAGGGKTGGFGGFGGGGFGGAGGFGGGFGR